MGEGEKGGVELRLRVGGRVREEELDRGDGVLREAGGLTRDAVLACCRTGEREERENVRD